MLEKAREKRSNPDLFLSILADAGKNVLEVVDVIAEEGEKTIEGLADGG